MSMSPQRSSGTTCDPSPPNYRFRTNAAAFGVQPIQTENWHWEYRPENGSLPQKFAALGDEVDGEAPIRQTPDGRIRTSGQAGTIVGILRDGG